MSYSLCFTYVHGFCFTLKTVFISSPWVSAVFPFQFSPPFHLGSVSEWLGGAELPAGLNRSTRASHLLAAKGTGTVAGFWVGHRSHSFLAQVSATIAKAECPNYLSASAASETEGFVSGQWLQPSSQSSRTPKTELTSSQERICKDKGSVACRLYILLSMSALAKEPPRPVTPAQLSRRRKSSTTITHNASSMGTSRPLSACHEHKSERTYLIISTIYNKDSNPVLQQTVLLATEPTYCLRY